MIEIGAGLARAHLCHPPLRYKSESLSVYAALWSPGTLHLGSNTNLSGYSSNQ